MLDALQPWKEAAALIVILGIAFYATFFGPDSVLLAEEIRVESQDDIPLSRSLAFE